MEHLVSFPHKAPYLKQHNHYSCELYNLSFICTSYGNGQAEKYIRKGLPNLLYKLTFHIFNRPMELLIEELEKDGFKGHHGFAKGSIEEKKAFLIDFLKRNIPVVVRIGSPIVGEKRDRTIQIKGYFAQHFMTVLGYSEEKDIFYMYEPMLPQQFRDKSLPIGNYVMPARILMKYWNFNLFWKRNFYFAIESSRS